MTDETKQTVVLIHGYGVPGMVMTPLGLRLRRRGLQPVNFSYRDIRATLAENAQQLARFLAVMPGERPHLVGHSLGGLLILRLLADHPGVRVGRIVLLGSPCAGSFAARWFDAQSATRWIAGGKSVRSGILGERPAWKGGQELGVVAGTRSLGLGLLIPDLPRPNDGLVTLEEALLPGASDTVVLKVSHMEMLISVQVAHQICAFLEQGKFVH